MSAFRIARQIHESQRRLAVAYPSPPEALLPWEELPVDGRRLMVAVVADLLQRGVFTPGGFFDFGPTYSNPDKGIA